MARNSKKNGHGEKDDFQEDEPRGNGTSAPGSNTRAVALDAAIEKWCALQKQEDDLIEKYIAPIRKKKNKVKSDLKAEHEIPTKAFNARASLRMIEREDDDEVVLAVNELFKATPVGNNLDLIALAERVEKARAEKAAKKAAAQNTELQA